MADSHAHAVHAHGPADTRPYIVIFVLLCCFTAVSFIVNVFVRGGHIAAGTGFVIILGVAVVKALCVAIYFMHLKWDWGRLYFLIIPALVLAPMLVLALLPDLVIYWSNLLGSETSLPAR
ncbi:MAG TPA: cytochrome C oxidase subunit IV family protein [Gemmataceae bacterium]|jgi:cytochrome c oxidase subunit 4